MSIPHINPHTWRSIFRYILTYTYMTTGKLADALLVDELHDKVKQHVLSCVTHETCADIVQCAHHTGLRYVCNTYIYIRHICIHRSHMFIYIRVCTYIFDSRDLRWYCAVCTSHGPQVCMTYIYIYVSHMYTCVTYVYVCMCIYIFDSRDLRWYSAACTSHGPQVCM